MSLNQVGNIDTSTVPVTDVTATIDITRDHATSKSWTQDYQSQLAVQAPFELRDCFNFAYEFFGRTAATGNEIGHAFQILGKPMIAFLTTAALSAMQRCVHDAVNICTVGELLGRKRLVLDFQPIVELSVGEVEAHQHRCG